MKKIFKEYGGVIIAVIAIVALIGLVGFLMRPGGVLDGAFGNIVQSFEGKTDELVEAAGSGDAAGEDELLYSFGVLSDVHVQYGNGNAGIAYQNALTYLKDNVEFTCVTGDLLEAGTAEFYTEYQGYVASAGSMPVYEIAGNHESTYYNANGIAVEGTLDADMFEQYTGDKLFYSFTRGNDVFIMVGMSSSRGSGTFTSEEMRWLEQTLEANKNKRCFVFQHAPALGDTTADPYGVTDNLMGSIGKTFVEMMKYYKNVTWFHGHTHSANINEVNPVDSGALLGFRTVHVPSLGAGRVYTGVGSSYDIASQQLGYIVDVYKNKIVIRAIDFKTGESVRDITLDTTLRTVNTAMTGELLDAGCTYTTFDGVVYNAGEYMPVVTCVGDEFDDGEYIYKYGYQFNGTSWGIGKTGWGVRVKDTSKTSYQPILTTINNLDVDNISFAFYNCKAMITAPEIPSSIKYMARTFYHCDALTGAIVINANPVNYNQCFRHTPGPITLTGSSTMLNEIATGGCDSSCAECGGSNIAVE